MCNDKKVKSLYIYVYYIYIYIYIYIYNASKSAYVKCYDGQIKWMYFLIEDDDLLEKYINIWDKVTADIEK